MLPGPGTRTRPPDVDLASALEGGDVVLLSLNSSVYGKLAAQLGALAIQDLTSAAGHRLRAGTQPDGQGPVAATVAIDEFSALGADNLLALLARGREAGVPVLLATQELTDLERAGRGFRDQVMGIVGVTIAHRQDVHSSATMISQLAGTEWAWQETETVRGGLFARPGQVRGTRRLVEQPVVHPNEIKTLAVGEMMMIAKLPSMRIDRVTVSAPPAPMGVRVSPARSPAGPRMLPRDRRSYGSIAARRGDARLSKEGRGRGR